MDTRVLLLILLGFGMLAFIGVMYLLLSPKREGNIQSLMGRGDVGGSVAARRERMQGDASGEEFERLKEATRKGSAKKGKPSLDEKFFQAGMFSPKEKREFMRLRILVPLIVGPVAAFMGARVSADISIIALVFGILVGVQFPFSLLDRRIKNRSEEIMYYLPLVIEQIAIGVSSSLDIGPCLQRIVIMADERDSHNPVTELIRHAQNHIRTGVSLESALNEVGKRSGHNELKHAFMSLSQVAKHGGEITRQLQELADAVSAQRETKIEAKIKKLELEATGPVALVFMGFLVILLIGFGLQIKGAFE